MPVGERPNEGLFLIVVTRVKVNLTGRQGQVTIEAGKRFESRVWGIVRRLQKCIAMDNMPMPLVLYSAVCAGMAHEYRNRDLAESPRTP